MVELLNKAKLHLRFSSEGINPLVAETSYVR